MPAELPGAASPCAQSLVLIRAREKRTINRARIYESRSDLFRAVFNGVGSREKCSLRKSVRDAESSDAPTRCTPERNSVINLAPSN